MRTWFVSLSILALASCKIFGNQPSDDSDLKFYGKDSREGDMTFEADVVAHIAFKKPDPMSDMLNSEGMRSQLTEAALAQVQHIFGALTTHPDFERTPAVIANDFKIELLSVSDAPGQTVILRYRYKDRVALHKNLVPKNLPAGGDFELKFVLPKDPKTIYSHGFSGDSSINHCTDHHYNSEGDFWYFWNPYQRHCPLTDEHLTKISARVKLRPSTTRTLPEYDLLYGDNGNGKKLKVVAIFGIDESFQSGDLGRTSYTNFLKLLSANGFTKTSDASKHKVFTLSERRSFDLEMHVWLLEAGSEEFDTVAIEAMEGANADAKDAADILLYDGHSGLGGYFSPENFKTTLDRDLKLPKSKYQIFAFQGCSTYAYYNKMYFDLKKSSRDRKGTKYLDILTAGIGLDFSVGAKQSYEILSRLLNGKKQTWQTIVNSLYNVSPELSAIHQINGDEDNPE
jgi:hypothetical protein